MTYLYEELSAPTRLYIKQCSHCDLKYFGKSVKDDLESYEGSGVYWQKHLKKHDAKSIHLWNSDWYYDTSIVRFATKFSAMNKIVESKDWANLKHENGLDGGDTSEFIDYSSIDYVNKISKYKDTIHSKEWKETIGKQKSEKLSNSQNDVDWKNTVGQEKIEKYLSKTNNSDWLDTKGKERSRKMSERAKNRDKFECQYCNGVFWKTHLNRWHGENCKHKGV